MMMMMSPSSLPSWAVGKARESLVLREGKARELLWMSKSLHIALHKDPMGWNHVLATGGG